MALRPDARSVKDDPSMTRPRRPRPPRAWQVETLEDRALLTTVYGPVGLEPPAVPPALKAWWLSRPAETAAFSGRTALISSLGQSFGQDLAGLIGQTEHPMLSFLPPSKSDSIGARSSSIPGSDAVQAIAAWKLDQNPDGTDPLPPFLEQAFHDFAGLGPPGRDLVASSLFARFRDELDGGLVRFGPKPFFLPISPETDWESGINGNPTEFIASAESESDSESPSVSTDRTESSSSEGEGRSQPLPASNLPAPSSGTAVSSEMIWVDVDLWAGETSLASIVLSRGELEPDALFPPDELPELTAILSSLWNELLGESANLSLPLAGPLQQITTLDPLDDSSLALTGTLLTVSSAPQAATPPGPGPVETDAALPDPPSWAGFVIGLNEAFEASRLGTRRWPAASEPYDEGGRRHGASGSTPTEENAAVDEAIRRLDREESSSPLLDELFLSVLEEADDEENPSLDPSWRDAAGPASLSLAILPALWAERLGSHPSRLQRRRDPDNLDKE
jgi:hypothetical protein